MYLFHPPGHRRHFVLAEPDHRDSHPGHLPVHHLSGPEAGLYPFADIRAVKQNSDSLTLTLTTGKVHMESIAILSQALVDRINRQLETAEP